MGYISKMNCQLVAVCAFNMITKTVDYHDFRKYYKRIGNSKN